jgi:hypothetical protein
MHFEQYAQAEHCRCHTTAPIYIITHKDNIFAEKKQDLVRTIISGIIDYKLLQLLCLN